MTEIVSSYPRLVRTGVLALLILATAGEAGALAHSRVQNPTPKPTKTAITPKRAPGAIATVGSRKVWDVDIRQAASALGDDPLRKRNPTAWRRMLLDRCVDRELLAVGAERRGLDTDPEVLARVTDREYLILLRELYAKVIVPGLVPSPDQLREIRAGGLHRGVDLHYILIRDTAAGLRKGEAQKVYQHAKAGARFDSLARIYSGHPPTKAGGGHFGWVLARDLDAASYEDVRKARPGDVIGVYSGPYGHEIYKIGAFQELTEDSLYSLVYNDRKRGIARDYSKQLLAQYHFALDPTQVKPFIFAVASETPDSILASLGPDGTREKKGGRPAIGVLARCDGDSVTFPSLLRATPPVLGSTGRMRVRDAEALAYLCGRAVLKGLTVRDAKERKLDAAPAVARELRMMRDEIRTLAMVERARPAEPDGAALEALFQEHADRHVRPRATVARVALFADPESAAAALGDFQRVGLTDSTLAKRRNRPHPRATPAHLRAGWNATVSLLAGSSDELTRGVEGVAAGQFAPVVATPHGYAVAQVISVEESRPYRLDEVKDLVLRGWRDEVDEAWVTKELARLRAATPVRVLPGRLEAVRIVPVKSAGG